MAFLPKIFPRDDQQRKAEYERSLMRMEAEIGGTLFGPVPEGHHRRFFCLDEHTWIWHEEWHENGQLKVITTRYDVRPNGIVKIQDGQATQMVGGAEAQNLYRAVEIYEQRINAEYDRIIQAG